ncbi:hypothetical protein CVS29_14435 [Arthrobacter psychrochitiniphilus]|uniref:Uncharacterized protein n=1 Tax=Arthrobacter psychrochitiniphilus TaxID=291045 RepID=A0A2V3DVC5_9MICC|nr:hypothetical protein CVS29_14435 [Arthrobacter psychrochitiniphilus]
MYKTAVTRRIPRSKRYGLPSPVNVSIPSAIILAVPVWVMNAESGIMRTTRIRACHTMERWAWPIVRTRARTMAASSAVTAAADAFSK